MAQLHPEGMAYSQNHIQFLFALHGLLLPQKLLAFFSFHSIWVSKKDCDSSLIGSLSTHLVVFVKNWYSLLPGGRLWKRQTVAGVNLSHTVISDFF